MGAHIDTYLSEYTIYSGNKERRGKLYASILAAAENQSTLKEEVAKWGDRSEKIISDRLHNTLREHNKKEKAAAAAAEAAAEVAVGLALIVALYRKRRTAEVEDLATMKL